MMKPAMIAYHNKPEIRADIIKQLEAHIAADQLVKGQYWENGKGCAIACTLHSSNHMEYETRFGIPVMLARLEDCIFEGLPNGTAKAWPIRFMSAIKPGHDLSLVGWKFLYWILTDETVNPGITHPLVKDAVAQAAQVICAISKGEPPNESAARSAAWSAESAAWSAESAESAARSAARSAAWSAESAAWSAAWSAARSAESAARSAAWSAESAARSAESAARSAAWSAESAARSAESAAYIKIADRLIELIEDAPMVRT
jgi:hypothetical protein